MKTITTRDPNTMRLVERQMRNWEIGRTQRLSHTPEQRPEVEDFICISREVGAGASKIAVLLAERLNWPVFDKELLHVMARYDQIREQIYASMDERDMSWTEATLRPFMQPEFVKNDYFHRLSETVLALARQGSAIFIGRGTDLVLPRGVGLRVRIIAPLEMRVKHVIEREDISEDEARTRISQLDADRAQYIQQHFHVDICDPQRYDLVINLQRLTHAQAVDLIAMAHNTVVAPPEQS